MFARSDAQRLIWFSHAEALGVTMSRFKEFVRLLNSDEFLETLDEILVSKDNKTFERFDEGKWVNGRFDNNIRIDQPTHGAGQPHAHIYGRKGNEIGVVNWDGSASHGTRCRLNALDADALRARGYKINTGNIVEWLVLSVQPDILFD